MSDYAAAELQPLYLRLRELDHIVDVVCHLSIDNESYPEPMASPRLAAVAGERLALNV
jgi:hypothetical protein